jgi:hypothetical protein
VSHPFACGRRVYPVNQPDDRQAWLEGHPQREHTPVRQDGSLHGPSGKIGFWFVNLPFTDSEIGYTAQGPTTANGAGLVHMGEASVAGQCSYRVTFTVPDVPVGTYGIVAIEHSGRGSAALGRPIEFRVTR